MTVRVRPNAGQVLTELEDAGDVRLLPVTPHGLLARESLPLTDGT